jgi:hypothetical protein
VVVAPPENFAEVAASVMLPASFRSTAITPWAGTPVTVMLPATVPLSVCDHISCVGYQVHAEQRGETDTYANGVLPSGTDPWRLSEVEDHVAGFVERVQEHENGAVLRAAAPVLLEAIR